MRARLSILLFAFAGLSFDVWAAESPTNSLSSSGIRLPIEFRRGSLHVSARVNGSNSLSLKLDTGFGVTTIHPDLVQSLGLKRAGSITIIGIAGEEQAETYEGA